MKEEFLKYIGPVDSLNGYVRSYKLVFYKCFFELLEADNRVSTEELTRQFRQYYISRKEDGKEPEKDADKAIQDIEHSSQKAVYNLILRNPFDAISSKGYVSKVAEEGEEYFELNPELYSELSEDDINYILDVVEKKLELYFSKIDIGNIGLQEMINRLFNEYIPAKESAYDGSHPMVRFINKEIPAILYNTGIINRKNYLITGSSGKGNWATVPWIAVFDPSITKTAQEGQYIVYLLSSDGKSLYLTFNQGCTKIRNEFGKAKAVELMRQRAKNVIENIDSRGFLTDDKIDLKVQTSNTAKLYEPGTIFYKEYKFGEVPQETELRQDLENMKAIYRDYVQYQKRMNEEQLNLYSTENNSIQQGGERPMTTKETIENIKSYIAAKGFTYEDGLIENFYLSIKSKPFVILAGISGTGKTRLVRLFAEAVGATVENGRYKMVSVRPDWSDSSDLFGHVDLNGNFIKGVIIDFLRAAQGDPDNPYFLCLDEMNLARVEYYLSDILSVIETRDKTDSGAIVSDPLISENYYGKDYAAAEKYGVLTLPDNLYIIGTVNMDETTFPFSRKVLDRANTIEFSYVNLVPENYDENDADIDVIPLNNDFFKTEYLLLSQCEDDRDDVLAYCEKLEKINQILQKAGAHVGYRVRDEIVFYLLNNKKNELLSEDAAFDNELMQKILPRIQGSSSAIKDMLCDLFKLCAGDYDGYQTQSDDVSSKMMKALEGNNCIYKHSAEKIAFMMRRFEEDGFTSYWL